MQIKADLHIHTIYSNDSIITPKDLVFFARKKGLDAVAITDHNNVAGALKIAKETDFLIIPGIEISTCHGHVIALNVQEPIARDLSADETVDRIHELGGLAIACHPFALLKGSIGKHVTAKFDAIETINASAFPFSGATQKANELAERYELPRTAGTDAHCGPVIGQAYTLVEADQTVDSITRGIENGHCEAAGQAISLAMRLENQGRFLRKFLKKN